MGARERNRDIYWEAPVLGSHMPSIGKRIAQRPAKLGVRRPHDEGGWERRGGVATRKLQPTPQHHHVGATGDMIVPPAGIGPDRQQGHHGTRTPCCIFAMRFGDPARNLATERRIAEHRANPGHQRDTNAPSSRHR
jgi:hypothetical protein